MAEQERKDSTDVAGEAPAAAAPAAKPKPPVSRLTGLAAGRLSGEIVVDAALGELGAVTLEVFAHGIAVASGVVRLGKVAAGTAVPFDIPARQFPKVDLPCELSARIAETDAEIESTVEIADLDGLWRAMLPWRAAVEGIEAGCVIVTLPVRPPQPDSVIFDLHEAGEVVATSFPDGPSAEGGMRYAIPLPEQVMDGAEHRLVAVHRGSNLPVEADPLFVVLQAGRAAQLPPMTAQQLAERMTRIETQMRERYAEAFNGLAAQLYQHVDRVALQQRANFEREVSALRRTLGLEDRATRPAVRPERVDLAFAEAVSGYGIHAIQTTSTGKAYRDVNPRCGIMVPAVATGAARLVVQGLRRSHAGSLEGARLVMNGTEIPVAPYVNPRGESWNITATVPAAALRADRNLLELRLPNGPVPGATGAAADIAVGILEISLTAEAAAKPEAARPAGTDKNAAAARPAGTDKNAAAAKPAGTDKNAAAAKPAADR